MFLLTKRLICVILMHVLVHSFNFPHEVEGEKACDSIHWLFSLPSVILSIQSTETSIIRCQFWDPGINKYSYYYLGLRWIKIKGLITVGKELRQRYPGDLLCDAGTAPPNNKSRHVPARENEGVVAVAPDQPWSIPIITWLNNFVSNVSMTKYVQNHHQIPHLPPLWRHASLLNDGIRSFTHPAVMRRSARRASLYSHVHKIVWPVTAKRVIWRYQNNSLGIISHHKHIWNCFFGYKSRV